MGSESCGVLDTPLEPVIGLAGGETRWRSMTANNKKALRLAAVAAQARLTVADYAVFNIGGADGRISANATWTIPPARPNATPIRQAMA
jgi:hypothetical protein